jgi:Flp pilus assembly protein TadB
MSRVISSTENSDDSRLSPAGRDDEIPRLRVIVAIIAVALILILVEAPYYHPLAFMAILVFVCGFALIFAYINRELVRSLRNQ